MVVCIENLNLLCGYFDDILCCGVVIFFDFFEEEDVDFEEDNVWNNLYLWKIINLSESIYNLNLF